MITKTKADAGTYTSAPETGWGIIPQNQERIYNKARCVGMGTGVYAKIRRQFGYNFQFTLRSLSERFAELYPPKHMGDKEQHYREEATAVFL